MRWALIVAGLLSARGARADDRPPAADAPPEDPRALFGFGGKPAAEPTRCDDARPVGCATATDPLDAVSPYALRTWLTSDYLLKLPVAGSRHDGVAHYGVGASRDEAGAAFGGATGLENRWTIEGAPADRVETGGVDTRVPLTFMRGMTITAGGFAARDRTSTGGTIDVELVRGGAHHAVEAHVWLGRTAERTRRPIPDASYFIRRLTVDAGPDASMSVVGHGPLGALAGGRAWYAAGIAPVFAYADFRWRAARLVDADDDMVPDGFPGQIVLEPIGDTTERTLDYLVPVMARAGWDRGPHAIDLTLIGHAERDSFFLSQATEQAAGLDREGYTGDAIATWKGRWRRTRARAQFAWHRRVRRESAHDPAAQHLPQRLTAYIPTTLAEEPEIAEQCRDLSPDDPAPGDPYRKIPNCPVPFGYFASGGAGLLVDTVSDRPTLTADVAHHRGNHVLRTGATVEDARIVTASRFTGGELQRSLFEGHVDRMRFYDGACPEHAVDEPAPACNYATSQELIYRTRYAAAYVEDTFEPGARFRVDGGLRWELMWVGPHLHFSDQLAPRLGVAWDPIGNGRSRVWTSMGRSFVMIPAGTGPTLIERNHTVRDVETPFGQSRNTSSGAVYEVAAGIEPAAQDEVTAGFELGVAKLVRLVAWVQGRTLRRGLETVIVDQATFAAAFDNPGRRGETPARRDTRVIALEVLLTPSPTTSVRASYLHGSTVGSWTGPFDPRQGTTLYDGSDWNFDSTNAHGPLPTDAGHRAFVEVERRGRVGAVELAVAARLTANSGRPRNVLANTDIGLIYLIPRGTAGRGPVLSQANVRVAARWRRLDITLDLFNAFDRREVTNLDEIYAAEAVRPIVGGTVEDLVWLKTSDDTPARRRTAYGVPNAFQAPIAGVLGIHARF